jgi:hypothetical protein
MQKFNYKIQSFEDLSKEFPKVTVEEYIDLLTNKTVKKLIKKEISRLEEDKIDTIWRKEGVERALKKSEIDKIKEAAKPAAVYWYFWALDHIEDQLMGTYNWREPRNRAILFRRMHKDGLDEFDREKDSIYEFIQSIVGGGRVQRRIKGRTFVRFTPYAKHEKPNSVSYRDDEEGYFDEDED